MNDPKHLSFLNKSGTTKLAVRILIVYFAVYYVVPLLLVIFSGPSLDAILRYPPSYFRGAIIISGVFFLTWFLIVQLDKYDARLKLPKILLLFHPFTSLVLAGIFFVISIYFWFNFGLQFRQTGDRIGSTGALGILVPLYALTAYFSLFIVSIIGRSDANLKKHKLVTVMTILLFIAGSILSIQASSGVVMIFMGLIQITRITINQDFLRSKTSSGRVGTIIFVSIAAILALFVGISNKIGVDSTLAIFTSDSRRVLDIFQNRISYHLFSASFHATYNLFNIDLSMQAISGIINNFLHRIDVILGNPTIFNEVSSVKRLNYEQISWHPRALTGTAPGIVGGLFFYPFGLFSAPLVCLFYAYMFRTVASVVKHANCGIFELLYLAFIIGALLDSSLDIMNPLDPAFIRLILLLVMVGQVEATLGRPKHKTNLRRKYGRA